MFGLTCSYSKYLELVCLSLTQQPMVLSKNNISAVILAPLSQYHRWLCEASSNIYWPYLCWTNERGRKYFLTFLNVLFKALVAKGKNQYLIKYIFSIQYQ